MPGMRTGISAEAACRSCAARLWRLFPHALLCLSLVAYAALGALLFQHIEGGGASSSRQEYRVFLAQIVATVRNVSGRWPHAGGTICAL